MAKDNNSTVTTIYISDPTKTQTHGLLLPTRPVITGDSTSSGNSNNSGNNNTGKPKN